MISIKENLSNFNDARVRSLLSINIDAKEKMVLYEGQKVQLIDKDDEIIPIYVSEDYIEGSDPIKDTHDLKQVIYPTVFQSSLSISTDGTSVRDIAVQDEDENYTYASIYLYSEKQDGSQILFSDDGDTVVTITNVDGGTAVREYTFKFKIPPTKNASQSEDWEGRYLIKLSTSSTNLNFLQLLFNDEVLKPIGYVQEEGEIISYHTQNNLGKNCYFSLTIPDTISTDVYNFYWGVTNTVPTGVQGLNSEETTASELLSSGFTKIKSLSPSNQYVVFALSNELGVEIDTITYGGVLLDYNSIDLDDVRIFYINKSSNAGEYSITFKSTDKLTIKLRSELPEQTVSVTLNNPFRYKPPTTMTYNEFEKYQSLVQSFDLDNIFDYSYQPDSDNVIDNPLEATSFFKTNHVMYDFVISQMSTVKNENLPITGEA